MRKNLHWVAWLQTQYSVTTIYERKYDPTIKLISFTKDSIRLKKFTLDPLWGYFYLLWEYFSTVNKNPEKIKGSEMLNGPCKCIKDNQQ